METMGGVSTPKKRIIKTPQYDESIPLMPGVGAVPGTKGIMTEKTIMKY